MGKMKKSFFLILISLVLASVAVAPAAAENVSEKNLQLEDLDIGWEKKYEASVKDNETNNYQSSPKNMTNQDEVTIQVGAGENGFAFNPPGVVVSTGTTVVWEWTGNGGQHNVVSEGDSDFEFESERIDEEGFTFEQTFEEEGAALYVCTPHRANGMYGGVAVVDNNSDKNEIFEIDDYLNRNNANLHTSPFYLNNQDQFFTDGIYLGPGENLRDYTMSQSFGYQWVEDVESENVVSYRVFSRDNEKITSSAVDLEDPEGARKRVLNQVGTSNIESNVSNGMIYEKEGKVTLLFVSDGYLVDMRYRNSNMTTEEEIQELEKYAEIVDKSGGIGGSNDSILILVFGSSLVVAGAIYYRENKNEDTDYL